MSYEHHLNIMRNFPSPQFPVKPLAPESLRNGIIVRMPNWLGDAVMALPALHQLKLMLPEHCALGVVAPAGQRALYHSLPWLDVLLPLSDMHRAWTKTERWMVRRFAPGAGVLFNNSLRDTLMFKSCGMFPLFGASARCRGIFLARSFPFPARRDGVLNQIHQSNKYLAMVRAIGAPAWDGVLPEIKIATPFQQLRGDIRALCDHPKLLILAAGAAYGAAKRWKSENFHAVAARWIEHGGIVATVGSPAEAPIGKEIGKELSQKGFFNMMGKTDMYELMHLLRAANRIVANDSGVMHLAAAFGRPGVAVFGSTDYSATGPISPNWTLLYSDRVCAPCFCRRCPHPGAAAECMADITPDMVFQALIRSLS